MPKAIQASQFPAAKHLTSNHGEYARAPRTPDVVYSHLLDHPRIVAPGKRDVVAILHQAVAVWVIAMYMLGLHRHVNAGIVPVNHHGWITDGVDCINLAERARRCFNNDVPALQAWVLKSRFGRRWAKIGDRVLGERRREQSAIAQVDACGKTVEAFQSGLLAAGEVRDGVGC